MAILGVKYAKRVEAAMQTMVNVFRWKMLDYVDAAAENVDPRVKEDFLADATRTDMTLTGKVVGRGVFTRLVANNSYVLGLIFNFPQYNVTNFMSLVGAPLWMRKWTAPGVRAKALGYAAKSYGFWLGGAAARRLLLAALLGIWDEEDDEVQFGIVMNPKHPRFLQLKVGRTFINLDDGAMKWYYAMRKIGGKTKLDPEALRMGQEIEVELNGWDRKQAFLKSMNAQTMTEFLRIRETGAGVDLDKVSKLDKTNLFFEDVVMNLWQQQLFEVFEKHGFAEALALANLITTGSGAQLTMDADEQLEREAERDRMYREGAQSK
jgi:hypothetical protein